MALHAAAVLRRPVPGRSGRARRWGGGWRGSHPIGGVGVCTPASHRTRSLPRSSRSQRRRSEKFDRRVVQACPPRAEVGADGLVLGQLGGPGVRSPGVGRPAGGGQQVGPYRPGRLEVVAPGSRAPSSSARPGGRPVRRPGRSPTPGRPGRRASVRPRRAPRRASAAPPSRCGRCGPGRSARSGWRPRAGTGRARPARAARRRYASPSAISAASQAAGSCSSSGHVRRGGRRAPAPGEGDAARPAPRPPARSAACRQRHREVAAPRRARSARPVRPGDRVAPVDRLEHRRQPLGQGLARSGTANGIPASRMRRFARTSRCAMVARRHRERRGDLGGLEAEHGLQHERRADRPGRSPGGRRRTAARAAGRGSRPGRGRPSSVERRPRIRSSRPPPAQRHRAPVGRRLPHVAVPVAGHGEQPPLGIVAGLRRPATVRSACSNASASASSASARSPGRRGEQRDQPAVGGARGALGRRPRPRPRRPGSRVRRHARPA